MHQCHDTSHFSEPMPFVGLYAAGASVICALLMAWDAISAFRRRRLWFPSSHFPLNATTLTFLSIAIKFPLDLNTSMPSRVDQLAKLSGSALVATAAANMLPSLASDPSPESIMANLVALAISIVTLAGNVGIQIGTGVIYAFVPEHIVVVVLVLALLLLLCSSALAVPATKRSLEKLFDDKFISANDTNGGQNLDISALKESVMRYWLMAHTASPQYVLGRSATCTASGALGLLTCATLIVAGVRSFRMSFCNGTTPSEYGWSTPFVFFSQLAAVVVGTVAPASRWFNAVSFSQGTAGSCKKLKAEGYWTQMLKEWKEDAFKTFCFARSQGICGAIKHTFKTVALDLLSRAQNVVVVASKVVRLASVAPMGWISRHWNRLSVRWGLASLPCCVRSISGVNRTAPADSDQYVLHLEGEEDLVDLMMRREREDTVRWIQKGNKKKPAHLIELIDSANYGSTSSRAFQGVREFDSSNVVSLVRGSEPPHCWMLPLVTLTTLALTLPCHQPSLIHLLRHAVSEGIRYVRLVEKHLDGKGLLNMRKAADSIWLEVYRENNWLNNDLRELASMGETTMNILHNLAHMSEACVTNFEQNRGQDDSSTPLRHWPAEVFASNCMYRVCRTILKGYEDNRYGTDDDQLIIQWLQKTICDILCACLTNLPRVIYLECVCNSVEDRENKVRDAAFLLGEAEDILQILRLPHLVGSYPERRQYLDDWRKAGLPQDQTPSVASTSSSTHSSAGSSDHSV